MLGKTKDQRPKTKEPKPKTYRTYSLSEAIEAPILGANDDAAVGDGG
jgi:hypothetical protein